jgi:hypothetical protein
MHKRKTGVRGSTGKAPLTLLGMAQGPGNFKLVEVDGSHEALFTRPAAVAEGLLKAIGP